MSKPKHRKRKPSLAQTWERLHRWFRANLPEVMKSLRRGASARKIKELEVSTRRTLPEDVKASLMIHDGEEDTKDAVGCIYGLLLLPIDRILRDWELPRRIPGDGAADAGVKSYPKQAIQECLSNPGWVPLTYDWSGNYIGVDLAPGLKGTWGQVIVFDRLPTGLYVVADSWGQFLADYADQLQVGNSLIERDAGDVNFNIKDPPVGHYHDAIAKRYKVRG